MLAGPWFCAGLLLYAIDVVLRSGQLSNTTLVTAASVDDQAGVATVQLRTSQVSTRGELSGVPMLCTARLRTAP